jgi:hypothetical protein
VDGRFNEKSAILCDVLWACAEEGFSIMYNEDTELLFPLRVIPELRRLRGKEWDQLIERVTSQEGKQVEQKAFVLMMVRMGGCLTCNADSFRAMRGRTQCAQRTVRRIREDDRALLDEFQSYCDEVEDYLLKRDGPQTN